MSKKLMITLAAAMALVLLIAGISSITRKNKTQEEESSVLTTGTEMIIVPSEMPEGINMQVPAGFTETNSPYYDKYFICNDASVIVTGEPLTLYGMDVKTYGESMKQQYREAADDFTLLSEEDTVVSEADCCLYEFTYAIKGEDAVQEMQCITAVVIKDERVYIVTCKSHRENFMNYRQAFRKMIESIQITGASPFSTDAAAGTQTEPAATEPTA